LGAGESESGIPRGERGRVTGDDELEVRSHQ
jgi:hypothetical protein